MTPTHATRPANVDDAPELARLLTMLGHPTAAEGIAVRWKEWRAEGNSALVVDNAGGTLAAAERALADSGCELREVTSNERRLDAHAFYAHLGYERTSVRFAKSLVRGRRP